MNSRERIIDDLQQQISTLLHSVSEHTAAKVDRPLDTAHAGLPTAGSASPPGPNQAGLDPRLAGITGRDEEIIQELMRLQRTLSRQSFRGAESARRVVRRLIRRARRNIEELQSLSPDAFGLRQNTGSDAEQVESLLNRIKHQLAELRASVVGDETASNPTFGAGEPKTRMPENNPQPPDKTDHIL